MSDSDMICDSCGKPFIGGQFVYLIRSDTDIDGGKMVYSHGNPCAFKVAQVRVQRRPIKQLWIQCIGKVVPETFVPFPNAFDTTVYALTTTTPKPKAGEKKP